MVSRKHLDAAVEKREKPGERRENDFGPPHGWRDRRRTVERRLPSVEEGLVSHKEWFRLLTAFISKRRRENKIICKAFGSLEGSLPKSDTEAISNHLE